MAVCVHAAGLRETASNPKEAHAMANDDIGFDVTGGPSGPSLASLLRRPPLPPASPPPAPVALDRPQPSPETPPR